MAVSVGIGWVLNMGSESIGNLTSFSGPTRTVSMHDASSNTDTENVVVAGRINLGTVSVEGNYDPAHHDAIETQMNTRASTTWSIVSPASATKTFTAFVSSFETGDMGTDGLVSFSAELTLTKTA